MVSGNCRSLVRHQVLNVAFIPRVVRHCQTQGRTVPDAPNLLPHVTPETPKENHVAKTLTAVSVDAVAPNASVRRSLIAAAAYFLSCDQAALRAGRFAAQAQSRFFTALQGVLRQTLCAQPTWRPARIAWPLPSGSMQAAGLWMVVCSAKTLTRFRLLGFSIRSKTSWSASRRLQVLSNQSLSSSCRVRRTKLATAALRASDH